MSLRAISRSHAGEPGQRGCVAGRHTHAGFTQRCCKRLRAVKKTLCGEADHILRNKPANRADPPRKRTQKQDGSHGSCGSQTQLAIKFGSKLNTNDITSSCFLTECHLRLNKRGHITYRASERVIFGGRHGCARRVGTGIDRVGFGRGRRPRGVSRSGDRGHRHLRTRRHTGRAGAGAGPRAFRPTSSIRWLW